MTNSLPTRPHPLFSVLIANYNNGKYLQAAIESVIAQTYSKWEIIIVDDDSSDNSREILTRWQCDNIIVHHNKENKGCGYSKKRCIELANGELCGFLDSDDILLPNALECHAHAHVQHPDASCIFSRYYICDEQLEIISSLRKLEIPDHENYFTHRDYQPEHFASFKRQSYLKTSGISPTLPSAVDQDLYFKLEEISPIYTLDIVTYKYRKTQNQISQGENGIKAFYWNLYVRHQTCLRRGLDPNLYPISDLIQHLSKNENDLYFYKTNYLSTISSKAYRIGKLISRLFYWLHKIRLTH